MGTATRSYTRFGVGLIDFDNNGQLDLFQANGRVTLPDVVTAGIDPFAEANVLLIGDGQQFRLPPQGTLPATSRTSRAAAFGDLNGDGAIDIVVVNRDAMAEVLINQIGRQQHWLLVDVVNEYGREDVGAVLHVVTGGDVLRRDANPHYSYLATNDPRVHVGLGEKRQVDEIRVQWVDGTREAFGPFEADQVIQLHKGRGRPTLP